MKSKSWRVLVMAVFVLTACEPDLDEQFDIYTIKKGEHYCNHRRPEMLQQRVLEFSARFDESAMYTFSEPGFQDSKNKLMGFSDCNSLHHENSARFAWQWYNDRLEIYAYCYVNGDRIESFLGTVGLNETASYRLELTDKHYVFTFAGQQTEIQRGSTCEIGGYMMLWPFFGGQLPAPHDITILIHRF